MIRGIQMLALMTLINSRYYHSCSIFLKKFMAVATIDVYFGEETINMIFGKFSREEPLNDIYELYEFSDMNFLMVSGSFIFPMFWVVLINKTIFFIIYKICIKYYRIKCCRK